MCVNWMQALINIKLEMVCLSLCGFTAVEIKWWHKKLMLTVTGRGSAASVTKHIL